MSALVLGPYSDPEKYQRHPGQIIKTPIGAYGLGKSRIIDSCPSVGVSIASACVRTMYMYVCMCLSVCLSVRMHMHV